MSPEWCRWIWNLKIELVHGQAQMDVDVAKFFSTRVNCIMINSFQIDISNQCASGVRGYHRLPFLLLQRCGFSEWITYFSPQINISSTRVLRACQEDCWTGNRQDKPESIPAKYVLSISYEVMSEHGANYCIVYSIALWMKTEQLLVVVPIYWKNATVHNHHN